MSARLHYPRHQSRRGAHPVAPYLRKAAHEDDVLRWMVVETVPNWERKVASRLQEQRYTVFLPVYLRMSRHARRLRQVQRAYFPRYLFVQFDPAVTPWSPIRNTAGVLQMLCDLSGRPLPVPDGFVEGLQTIAGRNGGTMPVAIEDGGSNANQFARGDRVKVIEGPLQSYEGVFDRDEGKRVKILISMFRGGTTEALVDSAQLRHLKT